MRHPWKWHEQHLFSDVFYNGCLQIKGVMQAFPDHITPE